MALENYLAEEVALDCAEGLMSRREALRRLALLGLSATAATTLLAACGDDSGDDASGAAATTASVASSIPADTAAATTAAPSTTARARHECLGNRGAHGRGDPLPRTPG